MMMYQGNISPTIGKAHDFAGGENAHFKVISRG